MTAILARFKKEMDLIVPYFATFTTQLATLSGAMASISGQYTDLMENLSGGYAYSVVSGGFIP